MEPVATGCGYGIDAYTISGGKKIYHTLHAMLSMCSFLVVEVGDLRVLGIFLFCALLEASGHLRYKKLD